MNSPAERQMRSGLRVVVGGADQQQHRAAGRDDPAADGDVFQRPAPHGQGRRVPAQGVVDELRNPPAVRFRKAQQRVADQVRAGEIAGAHQQSAQIDHLRLGSGRVHEPGNQIVPALHSAIGYRFAYGIAHRGVRCHDAVPLPLGGQRKTLQQKRFRPLLEFHVAIRTEADVLGDDHRRQRPRISGDGIELGRQRVSQGTGNRFHPRPEVGDGTRRERGIDQSAQPGVLRVVEVHQVRRSAGHRVVGTGIEHLPDLAGIHGEPPVLQQRGNFGIAAHRVAAAIVVNRVGFPQARIDGIGITLEVGVERCELNTFRDVAHDSAPHWGRRMLAAIGAIRESVIFCAFDSLGSAG